MFSFPCILLIACTLALSPTKSISHLLWIWTGVCFCNSNLLDKLHYFQCQRRRTSCPARGTNTPTASGLRFRLEPEFFWPCKSVGPMPLVNVGCCTGSVGHWWAEAFHPLAVLKIRMSGSGSTTGEDTVLPFGARGNPNPVSSVWLVTVCSTWAWVNSLVSALACSVAALGSSAAAIHASSVWEFVELSSRVSSFSVDSVSAASFSVDSTSTAGFPVHSASAADSAIVAVGSCTSSCSSVCRVPISWSPEVCSLIWDCC